MSEDTQALVADCEALAEVSRLENECSELRRENAQLNRQVTDVQKRCTELLEEKRRACVDYAVREFHLKYGHPAPTELTVPDDAMIRFRLKLVAEEFLELVEATFKFRTNAPLIMLHAQIGMLIESMPVGVNLPEFMDATHDLDYVVAGTRVVFGYDGIPGAAEVHRSNMQKIPNGLGKPTKPEGWTPPDIEGVLRAQGFERLKSDAGAFADLIIRKAPVNEPPPTPLSQWGKTVSDALDAAAEGIFAEVTKAAGDDEDCCVRCGAPYGVGGQCSKRQDGCQGGRGENQTPPAREPKLKEQNGSVVFASNGLRAVSLDRNGNEEILTVILPEGVRLFVMASDSGLVVEAEDDRGCLYVDTVRIGPKPTLESTTPAVRDRVAPYAPPTNFKLDMPSNDPCAEHERSGAKTEDRMRDALTSFCYLTGRLTGPSEGQLLALRMARVEAIERRQVCLRTVWDAPDTATVEACSTVMGLHVDLAAPHWRQPKVGSRP